MLSAEEPITDSRPAQEMIVVRQPDVGWIRIVLVVAGVSVLGLLMTTRILDPDPSGMGTHEQLGLAECGFKLMLDIPCPSCGMTTSWAWLTRGHILNSLHANPGGTLLGFACLVFGTWMVISGARGRWFVGVPSAFWFAMITLVIVGVTVLHWLAQIWK